MEDGGGGDGLGFALRELVAPADTLRGCVSLCSLPFWEGLG